MMSTFVGESAVGAQTILRIFLIILAILPYGFSCASGYFIGKAIGEKDLRSVKLYYKVSICFGTFLGVLLATLILSLQK